MTLRLIIFLFTTFTTCYLVIMVVLFWLRSLLRVHGGYYSQKNKINAILLNGSNVQILKLENNFSIVIRFLVTFFQ